MNNKINKSRRNFLIGGLTAAGGLSLGFYIHNKNDSPYPILSESSFQPNAWLIINKNNSVDIILTEVEMGQGVMTSIPMLIAEELDVDWNTINVIQAPVDPVFGWQGTGGSRSIRLAWTPLRQAGATARYLLIQAASELWNVPYKECTTDKSYVIHNSTNNKIPYGDLLELAADQNIPDEVQPKSSKDFQFIGKPVQRLDTQLKVTGKAVFGIDVVVPGMKIAAIKHCPVFGGKFVSYDKEQAESLAGADFIIPLGNAVAVVSDDYWSAQQALNKLSIKWDLGKNTGLNTSIIEQTIQGSISTTGKIALDKGNIDNYFNGNASMIFKRSYQTDYQAHATMEPMCCTAHVSNGKCEIWAPTQQPSGAQNAAAEITGFPGPDIKIHTTLLGGGFGRRNIQDFVKQSVKLSQHVNAPVKLIWSREEDIQHDYYNPATYHELNAVLDEQGLPIALEHKIAGSAYAKGSEDIPYTIPNIRVHAIDSSIGIPLGPWRSVAYSYNVFAIESFIDELAVSTNHDPLEYRLKLLKNSPRLYKALELVAEKSGWHTIDKNEFALGIAITASFGSYVAQVAQVSINEQNKPQVEKVTCVIDCGTAVNPDTVKSQIEGSVIFGITAALKSHITIENGSVVQSNFHDFPLLNYSESPIIDVHIINSDLVPGGVGEPGVPPVAPAITNAIFAATKIRHKKIPIL